MDAAQKARAREAAASAKAIVMVAASAANAGQRLYLAVCDRSVSRIDDAHAELAVELNALPILFRNIRAFVADDTNSSIVKLDSAIAKAVDGFVDMSDAARAVNGRKFTESMLAMMAALETIPPVATRLHKLARRSR